MDIQEAMRLRHAVRSYTEKPIPSNVKAELQKCIDACNQESGLHIQLVCDEPKAFSGFKAHYGKFKGVRNYLALIGKKCADLDERCGYEGEKIVLTATKLGLQSCWVAMTYSKVKSAYTLGPDEKLVCVVALGYGTTTGVASPSKTASQIMESRGDVPAWFASGVKAALLAPTAVNQQKFTFVRGNNTVKLKMGSGFCINLDKGIVKYHFEVGAGTQNFSWA